LIQNNPPPKKTKQKKTKKQKHWPWASTKNMLLEANNALAHNHKHSHIIIISFLLAPQPTKITSQTHETEQFEQLGKFTVDDWLIVIN
jgi:hypothetical protein